MDKPKDTTLIKWSKRSSDTRQFNITHLVRGCSKNKHSMGLHGSSVVKNLPAMQKTQETQVGSLSQKDSMEKEMAAYFSILAWKLQGQGILEGYGPQGCKESDTTERTHAHTHTHHIWESPLKDAWILSLKRKPKLRGLLQNSWPLKSWNARENWENVPDWTRLKRRDNLLQHVSLKWVLSP